MVLLALGAAASAHAEPRFVRTQDGVLNLQAEPHWWATSHGLVRDGQRVDVVERKPGWVWVIHGGRSGWIEAKYLAKPPEPRAGTAAPLNPTPVVASSVPAERPAMKPSIPPEEPVKKYLSVVYPENGTLNLRAGPGVGFEVIAPMERGSWVQVQAHAGNWAKLRHESGVEGWAARKYLTN